MSRKVLNHISESGLAENWICFEIFPAFLSLDLEVHAEVVWHRAFSQVPVTAPAAICMLVHAY